MKSTARDVAAIGTLVLAVVLGLATQAQAANLEVRISDGVNPFMPCLDGATCDANGLPGVPNGVVSFAGTINDPTTAVDAVFTITASATPGPNDMSLDYTLNAALVDRTYTIEASDNFLTGTALVWNGIVSGTQTTGDTTNFDFFANTNNVKFVGSDALCQAGPFSGGSFGPAAADCAPSAAIPLTDNQFSLTEMVVISNITGATGESDFTVGALAVLEPGTLFLLGSGLALAGMWGRRKTVRTRAR